MNARVLILTVLTVLVSCAPEASARILDSELGRWTRRDPLGYVDGMGLYGYISSASPTVDVDPLGLCASGHCADRSSNGKGCPVFQRCNGRVRQHRDHPPEPREKGSCGAGPLEPFIPDKPIWDFLDCCKDHDVCYTECDTEGNLSNKCDDRFCKCVHDKCPRFLGRLLCHTLAGAYCLAVRTFGPGFFCDSQETHCECIAEH
jgi:hypothetical protein